MSEELSYRILDNEGIILLDRFLDDTGIVVEFPETLSQKLRAMINYAKLLECDFVKTDEKLDGAIELIQNIADRYHQYGTYESDIAYHWLKNIDKLE